MSLVNAVHTLLEVAAGRLNLTPQAADELHAAIDAEQGPPDPTHGLEPSGASAPDITPPSTPIASEPVQPWQS